jgi:hypothetical protein
MSYDVSICICGGEKYVMKALQFCCYLVQVESITRNGERRKWYEM